MSDDPYGRLERVAESIAAQSEYEQANRRGLLWVHGLVGLLGGIQMLLWGTAPNIEAISNAWVRYPMGLLGIFGGVLLILGLTRRPRSIPHEAVGLAAIGLWDALMTIGLATARYRQDDFQVIGLGKPLPEGYVTAYPTVIYGGLFALIVIHLITLRLLFKARGS